MARVKATLSGAQGSVSRRAGGTQSGSSLRWPPEAALLALDDGHAFVAAGIAARCVLCHQPPERTELFGGLHQRAIGRATS